VAPQLAAPIVSIVNQSGSSVRLPLTAPLESIGVRGHYLRTLLRSDRQLGPQDLGTVSVPAYGVYVGEVHR
jgi:hypothetical protein